MKYFAHSLVLPLFGFLLAACFAAEPCIPEISSTFTGQCVAVKDGDTITVLRDKEKVTVRLEGIDAPEKGQDHGARAAFVLSSWIRSKDVTVGVTGKDKYGRTLGIVICDGENINEKLLREGWAWQYVEFNCDERYAALQASARGAERGLWKHSNAIPPWEFRKLEKERTALAKERAAEAEQSAKYVPTPARIQQPMSVGYWLNTNGYVRHNSTCRYYRNTKSGRPCGPNEGRPCGICGG